MAASDHLSDYIRVYHSSYSETPPHEYDHPFLSRANSLPDSNVHKDIIHAGTERSALDLSGIEEPNRASEPRKWMHSYLVPKASVYPVVFGDESLPDARAKEVPSFAKAMRGVQEGLFETMTGTPEMALDYDSVIPYRNRAEDRGSISYMIPKHMVGDRVIHEGVEDLTKRKK
jgi:hypothetical protein